MSTPTAYVAPSFSSPIELDLSRNEGSTQAAELLATVTDPDRAISRYPDTGQLRERIAVLNGVGRDQVLVTAGGDEALHRCFLALLEEEGHGVTTTPTFEMIPRYAEQRRVSLTEVEWWADPFPVAEVAGAADTATAAAFVVSPNNPTGAVISETDLQALSTAFPWVVLDAAYIEFADQDLTRVGLGLGNVVVIRTLSKAYGLAGLRVGYLLASAETVARFSSYGSPFAVSTLSAALALARLERDPAELTRLVDRVREERDELTGVLDELGARPVPSQANFVLAFWDDPAGLVERAAAMGVALRHFPDRPGLESAVRITLPGDPDGFGRLVTTLRTAVGR